MPGEITPGVQRLHELAWQTGAWIDGGWWERLGLAAWRDSYTRHPACRRDIDQLIAARRQFPRAPLPARLDAREESLMALEPRLPALASALGLVALACPDYLLIGQFRRALAPSLSLAGCDQLIALYDQWDAGPPTLPPEALPAAALDAGTRWLAREADANPVIAALTGLLPPPCGEDTLPPGPASPHLIKLGRFL